MSKPPKTRNSILLASFVAYCEAHPHERFWQALRNWSGEHFILAASGLELTNMEFTDIKDTFSWEGKNG